MTKPAELFKNRIIGYGTKPADQFQANPQNYRKHPQRQRDAVSASLRSIGWIATVIENRQTGNLIDGHERVWQALPNNEDVPYLEVDLSPDEERLALAVFDPITNMAEIDPAIFDDLLHDINTDEPALQELLDELAQGAGLYDGKGKGDTEPEIDRAEELRIKWQVVSGQLWQLGDHRLICGDCTDAATVARVMGGEKAQAVVTDPPYNLGDSWSGLQEYRNNEQVQNDSRADFDKWFCDWLALTKEQAANDCSFYVWYALRTNVRQMVEDAGFTVHAVIIWVKEHYNVGRADYHSQYEPCLYFSAGDRHWCGRRDISDVWHANRVEQERIHPTQKPLSLISLCVDSSTATGAIVYEPFSGSGTTLIACENLSRRCRAVEISAAYCAVTLERWHVHTGNLPVLLEVE